MDFKTIRIPYEGREKYPSKGTGEGIVKTYASKYLNNASSMAAGAGDIDRGGATSAENRGSNATNFNLWLSKTSGVFNYAELVQTARTDTIEIMGYRDTERAQVFVGDISESAATGSYNIQWNGSYTLPQGMSITVTGNGTTEAAIKVTIDASCNVDQGELSIPIALNINDNTLEPYHYIWYYNSTKAMLFNMTYSWSINRSEGTPGATIRGPYDYNEFSATTRWWCAGTPNSAQPETEKWIDVIVKDGDYFYCNTTYYGTLSPWADVSSAWTQGESFEFVATNLLLASGAAINFITGNELYLRDSNNNITAGAMGGDGVNFWAGSANPSGAPFKVGNDGTIEATKGKFGILTIGTDEFNEDSLTATQTVQESEDTQHNYLTTITPQTTKYIGEYSNYDGSSQIDAAIITPDATHDYQYNIGGVINVVREATQFISGQTLSNIPKADTIGIAANGRIRAHAFQGDTRHYKQKNTQGPYGLAGIGGAFAILSELAPGMEIEYLTNDLSLFSSAGTWVINGVDTKISHKEPSSLFTYDSNSKIFYFDGVNLMDYGVAIPTASTNTYRESDVKYWHFNNVNLGIPVWHLNNLGQKEFDYPYMTIKTAGDSFGLESAIRNHFNGYWFAVGEETYSAKYTGIASSAVTRRNNTIYITL